MNDMLLREQRQARARSSELHKVNEATRGKAPDSRGSNYFFVPILISNVYF